MTSQISGAEPDQPESSDSPPLSQDLLSAGAITTFRLNGQFLALAENLARPAGLTATRWQVLGAITTTAHSVSDIARIMGITRQSVQRTADLLVADGLAEFRPNPHHKQAKLVAATDEGIGAVRAINPQHAQAAQLLVDRLGAQRLQEVVTALEELVSALEEPSPIAENV